MNFRIFPATITPDGRKVPLIKGWQELATTDIETIKMWQNLFRENLKIWGIPTGPINDIFVLDADVKGGGLETIKTLEIPNTLTQATISGGRHFFFRYPKDGRQYGNRVKFLPGLDTRGVGGWAAYYGTDNTPIADAPRWLLEQAVKAPEPINPQGAVVKVAPEIAQGIIQTSLDNIRDAPEGESNNVLNIEAFRVGQLVASGSITREYAEQALYRAAIDRGKPQYEAKATITSGLDGGAKKPLISPFGMDAPVSGFPIPTPPAPPSRWTPEFFTHQDLMNTSMLKKPQLFEHWSTEDIHITTADGGTGKTTLKLFEAVCLALGERFLGFNCTGPGKTLFLTGEDTDKKLGAMIGQICRQMGLFEGPQHNEKVRTILSSIVVKKDADLCLITKDRQGFLHPNQDAMAKVMQAVEDIQPKMIVFDPISSFWGSESALNDMNKAVTRFMADLVERGGVCVEMINHMGKRSSGEKDMSQFAGRGGSGLPSNARVSRTLRPVGEQEYLELTGETMTERQSAILCNVNKFTDGSPLYNKPFLILRDGYLFSRKQLTDAKIKEAEEQLSDQARVFQFVKEARVANKFPTEKVVIASFMADGNPLSKGKVQRAIHMLSFNGHMGEKLKLVENPDQSERDRVFVITDEDGTEI